MMTSGPGDNGSVFFNSAQDVLKLVIDGDRRRIRKEVEHGSNFESRLIRMLKKCSESRVTV